MTPAPAIETSGLGKRYGSTWALQECSVTVPTGAVTALVGPNGAGKTTLLRLLVGLSRPSAGSAHLLGLEPGGRTTFLYEIGYLAQDVPLYKRLTASEHLEVGAHLNRRWAGDQARQRLLALQVPLDRPVSTLSGGQRAQVALGLALAKSPKVLLLDEPVAALDPLARRQFLASLAEAVAEEGLTVVLSSHLVHDLERVCDHVILLSRAHTQLSADIETVLAQHRLLVGPRRRLDQLEPSITVVKATQTENQTRLVARLDGSVLDPSWSAEELGLEDVILAYMSEDVAGTGTPLSLVERAS
jgi:ABC-2 type transport system ATP-binding protein